jgi:hypothetical protein
MRQKALLCPRLSIITKSSTTSRIDLAMVYVKSLIASGCPSAYPHIVTLFLPCLHRHASAQDPLSHGTVRHAQ